MKRFSLVLLLLVILLLPGCGAGQEDTAPTEAAYTAYTSDTSAEDCYLCGSGMENLVPSYWGQNNIALISLNTFEIRPIEINRYDRITGQLIEEYAGTVSFGGGGSVDGGFSASLLVDYDRGYATGTLDFCGDEELDLDKTAAFLCKDCLNEILPTQTAQCFGVGLIHLGTEEIRILERLHGGFGLDDFYINYDVIAHDGGTSRMDVFIVYCPIRYESLS